MKEEEKKPKKSSKIALFKEQLKDPKKKILFKLGGWLLFFFLIYVFLGVTSAMSRSDKPKDNNETTKVSSVNFSKMKKNLVNKNLNVKYKYGDYYIEGIVQDNVFSGTLEDNQNNIIKIKYDGTNLYRVNKQEEMVDQTLLVGFNLGYLIPSYIINLISEDVSPNKSSDGKIYSYNIDDKAISLYLSDKDIEKIVVLDNNLTYNLEYAVIK